MPSSTVRTFIDPDTYFAGIRNLQIDGVVTKRGEFRAESTRIDLHRLWMHRLDESLPRIMRVTPSGKRSLILFATNPHQPTMQVSGIEIIAASNRNVRVGLAVLPSILCGLRMGYHVADARGSRRHRRGHHWAPGDATLIPSIDQAACAGCIPAVAAARRGGPPCEDSSRHSCQARSSASDRGGFARSNDLVRDRGPIRPCAQCPSASREGLATSRGGSGVHPR